MIPKAYLRRIVHAALRGEPIRLPHRTAASVGPHWLEVNFATARRARALCIREILRAPFVSRVDLVDDQGASHIVFEGGDATPPNGWLEVKLGATPYRVSKARIWTSAARSVAPGPEQIDAVRLDGVYEESYAYNLWNQLTTVADTAGKTTTFGYDGNGNQTTRTCCRSPRMTA